MALGRVLTVSAICVLLVLLVALGGTQRPSSSSAAADDATHTTSLSLQPVAFPPSTGSPRSAVVATLDAASDPMIQTWSIDLYQTPPGLGEVHWGDAATTRASGETSGVSMSVELATFASGTSLRTIYRCLDGAGGVLWTCERLLAVP